jgi:hypothetical protein
LYTSGIQGYVEDRQDFGLNYQVLLRKLWSQSDMEYQQEAFVSVRCNNTIPSIIDRHLLISLDSLSNMQAVQTDDQTYAIPTAGFVAKVGLLKVITKKF